MLISHSHRFIFFHVAKTGGMSMRDALLPYAEEPDRFKIKRPPAQKAGRPNPFYAVWEALLLHATASDAQKELSASIFDCYYKFAFVRNPWDWQVSMYHFILNEPTHIRHNRVVALGSFDRYLEWVVESVAPYPKGASKHQHAALTDETGRLLVDFVGHYETLAQDFAYVCHQLGIAATLPHLNRSTHHDYRAYYTERSWLLVAEHFATDIQLFGYTADLLLPA
ncbi:MAG: sulfotransferase family 2 domain-containing protein [Caldilinea sp.]